MNISLEMIKSFNMYEKTLLKKQLLNSTGTGVSKKYLQLFELLCADANIPQKQIVKKIYGSKSEKDKAVLHAYHQLRVRLNEKMEEFILQKTFEEDAEMKIIKFISIARHMYLRKCNKMAWYFLKKAEELGKKLKQYETLNRIYTLQIEYSWTQHAGINKELIKKKQENWKLAEQENNLNIAASALHFRLIEARVSEETQDIEVIAERVLNEFNIGREIKKNSSFLFNMAMIASSILYEKKDYKGMEQHLVKIYSKMEKANLFNRYNHWKKIKILYLLGLVTTKSRRFDQTEKYINKLYNEQEKYAAKNSPSANTIMLASDMYICTGRYTKALEILEELAINASKFNTYDLNYLYLNLAAIYVIKENYTKALQCLIHLQHSEKLYMEQSGIEGVYQKYMLECIIQYETGDYEYVHYRLKANERKFKKFLADPAHLRDKVFLALFKQLNKNKDLINDKKFIEEVNGFIAMKPIEPGDTEFISFNAWLKAKIEKRKYYDIFLEMVS